MLLSLRMAGALTGSTAAETLVCTSNNIALCHDCNIAMRITFSGYVIVMTDDDVCGGAHPCNLIIDNNSLFLC